MTNYATSTAFTEPQYLPLLIHHMPLLQHLQNHIIFHFSFITCHSEMKIKSSGRKGGDGRNFQTC
jgi:hypothetical protein